MTDDARCRIISQVGDFCLSLFQVARRANLSVCVDCVKSLDVDSLLLSSTA